MLTCRISRVPRQLVVSELIYSDMSKMLLKFRSSCPLVNSVMWNWRSAKLHKFYKKVSVIGSLLNRALIPLKYNSSSKDIITGVFLQIYLSENIFPLFHFTETRMLYKIHVFENSAKSIGNHLYQTVLTPAQSFSWEFFKNSRNNFFMEHLWATAFYFNLIFLLFKDVFA